MARARSLCLRAPRDALALGHGVPPTLSRACDRCGCSLHIERRRRRGERVESRHCLPRVILLPGGLASDVQSHRDRTFIGAR